MQTEIEGFDLQLRTFYNAFFRNSASGQHRTATTATGKPENTPGSDRVPHVPHRSAII